jgi:hypothetical protein
MSETVNGPQVRIETWAAADLALLRLMNAPEMMEHLGGPETEEQILSRHKRYLEIGGPGTGRMYSIVLLPVSKPSAVSGIGTESGKKRAYTRLAGVSCRHFRERE